VMRRASTVTKPAESKQDMPHQRSHASPPTAMAHSPWGVSSSRPGRNSNAGVPRTQATSRVASCTVLLLRLALSCSIRCKFWGDCP
jgi:hypothetical protein